MAQRVARQFIDREIIIRAEGRIGYLRISARHQKYAAVVALGLAFWLGVATGSFVLLSAQLDEQAQQVEEQRLAYLDLLTEASAYQRQFGDTTKTLKQDQDFLLARLETELGQGDALSEIRQQLNGDATAGAQAMEARDNLRRRLEKLATDLQGTAEYDQSLKAQMTALSGELTMTRDERTRLETAGADMARAYQALDDKLRSSQAKAEGLRRDLALRNEQVAEARATIQNLEAERAALVLGGAELEKQLAAAKRREADLTAELDGMADDTAMGEGQTVALERQEVALWAKIGHLERRLAAEQDALAAARQGAADLRKSVQLADEEVASSAELLEQQAGEIESLKGGLTEAGAREKDLERRLAESQGAEAAALGRADALEEQISLFEAQLALLEGRAEQMASRNEALVRRYQSQALETVEHFEKTIAMTGLEVDSLLAAKAQTFLAQGGPFIAGEVRRDHRPEDLRAASLNEKSLDRLDLQLERWSALREVLGTLPLAPPLEQYEITSSFGARTDPLNGRKARHNGLDFRSQLGSSVYSTAPGEVVVAGWYGHFGRTVEIDHGHGIRTRYAHLRSILVKRGEQVANHQKVGLVGSSGRSTGTHLHYEVLFNGQPQDPAKFLTAGKYVFKD